MDKNESGNDVDAAISQVTAIKPDRIGAEPSTQRDSWRDFVRRCREKRMRRILKNPVKDSSIE